VIFARHQVVVSGHAIFDSIDGIVDAAKPIRR